MDSQQTDMEDTTPGTAGSAAARWVRFAEVSSLSFQPGHAAVVADREIALFRHGEDYFAIDAGCRHQGASLAEGDFENGLVTCAWHGWCYDVRTGVCETVAEDSVTSYPVRIVDGWVEVAIPA